MSLNGFVCNCQAQTGSVSRIHKNCLPLAPQHPSHLSTNPNHCPLVASGVLSRKAPGPNLLRVSAVAAPIREVVASESATSSIDDKPLSAETARTVVDLVAHGTLSTVGEDGVPLGTFAAYVLLGNDGQPILRLRADAVHTANLLREPRCSLFIVPDDRPARLLARVTLIGKVEPVDVDTAIAAAEKHRALHGGSVGVDAPMDTDLFYRLVVERCFFVGGMGSVSQAEVIAGDDYRSAQADRVRDCAATCVEEFNRERTEDVLRIAGFATGTGIEPLSAAELLWIDRLGIYIWAALRNSPGKVLRVRFQREVTDERDVRSTLTMLAQLAWEKERNYTPVLPQTPDPVAN